MQPAPLHIEPAVLLRQRLLACSALALVAACAATTTAQAQSSAQAPVQLVKALDDLPAAVAAICRPGDLVITLGAGSIGAVGDRILAALARGQR